MDLIRALSCLLAYGRAREWAACRSSFLSPEWDRICRLAGKIRHRSVANQLTVVKPTKILKDIAEGRTLGDTTTLADPAVMGTLKEQYEEAEG